MRYWRKVWGEEVVQSDMLAACDFDMRWLWVLYVLAQDDEGKYPYSRMRLLALALGTEWTWDDCQRLTGGLSSAGLITVADGYVYVTKGREFNGRPRLDRSIFLYDSERGTSGQPMVGGETEKSREREEERREEENPAPPVTLSFSSKNKDGFRRKNAMAGPQTMTAAQIAQRKRDGADGR